ncbi:hypothetical protein O181_062974 [Austropuccinia psidii MF-1]|uniref:Uncharacterized protein n=1 Tax=Austropuccinia psidii MF-1 TaxID=1389203 RepID=A0A9Q3EL66_9BASI|nr:hypothetical protein [Austropuccinia psidii MF-1]
MQYFNLHAAIVAPSSSKTHQIRMWNVERPLKVETKQTDGLFWPKKAKMICLILQNNQFEVHEAFRATDRRGEFTFSPGYQSSGSPSQALFDKVQYSFAYNRLDSVLGSNLDWSLETWAGVRPQRKLTEPAIGPKDHTAALSWSSRRKSPYCSVNGRVESCLRTLGDKGISHDTIFKTPV